MSYDAKGDIRYLARIARGNLLSARLLWNCGFFMPALHMLGEAVEKYLKVLWASDKIFSSQSEFHSRLKKFSHQPNRVFRALTQQQQRRLNLSVKNYPVYVHDLEALRYGTQPGFGFNEKGFRGSEVFIKEIRRMLGENPPASILLDFDAAINTVDWKAKPTILQAVKMILGSKRTVPTKKQRKRTKRRFLDLVQALRDEKTL